MNIVETNIEDEFLSEDVDEGIKLIAFRDYCIAEMNKCLNTQDFKGVRRWLLEHKRTVNDLEFLQFKKTDHERKMKIEK